jgi:cytochrome c5
LFFKIYKKTVKADGLVRGNMKRKIFALVVIATIAIFTVTFAFAAGDARKGKKVWQKSCRLACHDGSKENVKALSPVSKTQALWDALLPKIKECSKNAGLTEKDAEDIFEYLYSHALDAN